MIPAPRYREGFPAPTIFVEVTDDDAWWYTPTDFDVALLAKAPAGMFGTITNRRYVFHSIIGISDDDPSMPCDTAVNTGSAYQGLTGLTGGLMFSVCSADYSPILSEIAAHVVNTIGCQFLIPQPVVDEIDFDDVYVEYTPGAVETPR